MLHTYIIVSLLALNKVDREYALTWIEFNHAVIGIAILTAAINIWHLIQVRKFWRDIKMVNGYLKVTKKFKCIIKAKDIMW